MDNTIHLGSDLLLFALLLTLLALMLDLRAWLRFKIKDAKGVYAELDAHNESLTSQLGNARAECGRLNVELSKARQVP